MIKLDFLFSPYFFPGISPNEASKSVQRVLQYIREKYPKVFVIGCGCPLSDGVGLVDAMRVGPDTLIPNFRGTFLGKLIRPRRVGSICQNLEKRSWTKRFWQLDPDVFVCAEDSGLKKQEIERLKKIIQESNGLIFCGDDLIKLDEERLSYLRTLFDFKNYKNKSNKKIGRS
jgi:hypothetical protein